MNAHTLAAAAVLGMAALPLRAAAQETPAPADTTRRDTAAVTVTVDQTTGPSGPADIHPAAIPRARRSINSITYEEVRGARVPNAFQLIQNLRPSWLRTPRGATSLTNHADIQVFMNGIRMGGREQLNNIPITSIRTVRLYTATEARLRFGGSTQAGVIEITSP